MMTRKLRQCHQQITCEIICNGHRREPRLAHARAGDGDEQIAGVGDAGIGEQALEIILRKRGEIAVDAASAPARTARTARIFRADIGRGEKWFEHAQEDDEARGLRSDARKAVIGVGAP